MVVLSLSRVSGHPHKMELSRPYRDLYTTLSYVRSFFWEREKEKEKEKERYKSIIRNKTTFFNGVLKIKVKKFTSYDLPYRFIVD